MGHFNKPHGVQGEVSCSLDCDVDILERFSCIVVDIDGIFVPFFINRVRTKTVTTALLTIDGINTGEQASATLVNKTLYVLKRDYDRLAEEAGYDDDEMLPADFFIGSQAVINDSERGKIVDIDDTTANVLFVIALKDGREVLIPAVDEMIDRADDDTIFFNVPDELLDLK